MRASSTARGLALVLGVIASGGALFILLKDDVVAGRWSDAFVLVPIMIVIALAAGHLATEALRSRKYLAAIGFALAFVLGTALTVYQSVGKQADTSDSQTLVTEASNQERKTVEDDLARARLRYTQALDQADRETGSGGCRQKCQDWKLRAREVDAQVRELEAKLKSMNPQKPVAADADRVAKVIHMLTGADERRTKALLVLVKPFAFSLLFELTAIAAFGFAFGHQSPAPAARVSAKTQPTPTAPEPPGGDRRDPNIVSWVDAYRERHGKDPSIPEVQRAFKGLGKTTAWRYCKNRHRVA